MFVHLPIDGMASLYPQHCGASSSRNEQNIVCFVVFNAIHFVSFPPRDARTPPKGTQLYLYG